MRARAALDTVRRGLDRDSRLAAMAAAGGMDAMYVTRRHRWAISLVVLVLAGLVLVAVADRGNNGSAPAASPSAGPGDGFASVVAAAGPSVVQIRSSRGLGSGIVYDQAGDIVTNAHVVAGSTRFTVTAADGSTHTGTLRGVFAEGDLAVVSVTGAKLRPARFADSAKVRTGEYALAIGNPLGLRSSVTQGIVSATSRTVSEGNGVALPSVIQTSAPINPGNSGGALVDASGAVIGVPTLAALDPELGGSTAPGIGFAISSNTVRSIAPQLIAHGRVLMSGRAWLGVDLRTLGNGGAFVASVVRGGPAADAGIQAGDLLMRVARSSTPTTDDVAIAIARQRPGASVPVEVRSPSGTRTVHVTLGQAPAG
jgi:putative serine protease PepD